MNMNRILAIALIAAGVVLLVFGFQAKDSFASEAKELIDGTPTDKSMWMIGGGAVAAVAGLALMSRGRSS